MGGRCTIFFFFVFQFTNVASYLKAKFFASLSGQLGIFFPVSSLPFNVFPKREGRLCFSDISERNCFGVVEVFFN